MTTALPSLPEVRLPPLARAVALTALTLVGMVAGIAAELLGGPGWLVIAAYLTAYLAGGVPASIAAIDELRRGRLDIELLMVLAALAAAAVGEARDGAILLFLFSLAGTLQDYAMGRTHRAVEALMELRPDTAHRKLPGGDTETVPIEDLAVGDIVVVRPGERLPVDGRVVAGSSSVDQAAVTGESMPIDKAEGDEVFAATVNGYGVIEVEITRPPADSTVARMVHMVTDARAGRAPSERFSDWFGQRYTVLVLAGCALALGVFLALGWTFDDSLYRAATLLVAASPCAVVISVPAAILSALASAARGGVLFKGGVAVEQFGGIDIVALDKTGTLTQGKPQVVDVRVLFGNEAGLLAAAAALEASSEHPIARAVVAAAKERGLEPPQARDVQAVPGHGLEGTVGGRGLWVGSRRMAERRGVAVDAPALRELEARGASLVLVGDERLLGVIAVADPARPSAADAIRLLRERGVLRVVMLTGDHPAAAHRIAKEVGIDEVYAELLPEDKVARIRELRRSGRVAFVGDGVNDAPALATADIGIAMGVGSDVAIEAGDVALISDDLARLPAGLGLARRANRIIRQNLAFAVGAMAVLVLLTLFAELSLPLAVIGHEGGTLLVVLNGLRLLVGRG